MTTPPPSPLATPDPWNLVSGAYSVEIVPHFEHYARDAIQWTGGIAGNRVLDVACGPGTLTMLAAREASSVTAVDFASEMIAILRRRISDAAVSNVEARIGDGQALELADGAFDRAYSMFGLMFFPDRARGLSEIKRVLAKGGRIAIGSWQPFTDVPGLRDVFAALSEKMPNLPFNDTPPLGDARELQHELEAAGFQDVSVHAATHGLEYGSPEEFTSSLPRTFAPLAILRQKLGEDAFKPIREAVDARVVSALGPGPGSVAMPAWIGVGTRP